MRAMIAAFVLTACSANGAPGTEGDDQAGDDSVARVDGSAGMVIDGTCSKTHEWSRSSVGFSSTTKWFNVVVEADADQVVWVLACDWSAFGPSPYACDVDEECTGAPFPYDSGCQVVNDQRIIGGKHYLDCGIEQDTTSGEFHTMSGGHWTTVTVHVD